MSTKTKIDLVMNLMYNLLLAVVLSAIAEAINAGGITMPNLLIDTIISYILEMFIAMCLPFTKWGQAFAIKRATPGSKKFRVLVSGVTAFCFATVMSLAMSFIGVVLMAHLPLFVWGIAWLKIWFLFIAIAWACAYFLIPVFVGIAMSILGIPKENHV